MMAGWATSPSIRFLPQRDVVAVRAEFERSTGIAAIYYGTALWQGILNPDNWFARIDGEDYSWTHAVASGEVVYLYAGGPGRVNPGLDQIAYYATPPDVRRRWDGAPAVAETLPLMVI